MQSDGNFTYTPSALGVQTDYFTFIANNGSFDSDPGIVIIQLGNRLAFDGRTKVSYVDAGGQMVTVSLTGAGAGYLLFDHSGKCDPSTIVLDGTTGQSQLTISARGRNATNIPNIHINGSLGSLAAPNANLNGDLIISGALGKLTLNDATGGLISIGPAASARQAAALVFDHVEDVSISSQSPIQALTATAWRNTDGLADTIVAPSLGSLAIKGVRGVAGDFQANLSLTDPDAAPAHPPGTDCRQC